MTGKNHAHHQAPPSFRCPLGRGASFPAGTALHFHENILYDPSQKRWPGEIRFSNLLDVQEVNNYVLHDSVR